MQRDNLLHFQNELLLELASGRGLQGIIDKTGAYSGKPVILTNASGLVLASACLPGQPRDHFMGIPVLAKEKTNFRRFTWDNRQVEGFVFPIASGKLKLGSLIILDADSQDDFFIRLGNQTALTCAGIMVKQNEFLLLEQQNKEAFLYDLLYGNIETDQDIVSRGEIWGWDLESPQGVIVFELEEYEKYSNDDEIVKQVLEIAQREITVTGEKPILLRKKGEVVVLITVRKTFWQEQKATLDLLVKKIKSKAEEQFSPRIIRVGVGRVYDQPSEIFRSYQEAKVALELGSLLKTPSVTPFFSDMGLARILYNHDYQELQDFYKETLGALERYDKEQSSDLLNSLEHYLLCRCDLKTAADALFLHPNTLRYRLKKIEEVLSIVLDDFDTKLNLMAAFKIKHLKKS
jgi:sugar diacid utilization regulator